MNEHHTDPSAATNRKVCDCGRVASHYFGGWECAQCFAMRKVYEKAENPYTHNNQHTPSVAGHEGNPVMCLGKTPNDDARGD